jgi:tetratricopeptide (TPR) repeat protein
LVEGGSGESIEYYGQAIARDPDFAKAYAAMAFSYDLLAEYGYLPPGKAFPKVKEAALRALEIDATTAEAYTALALAANYHDYDWARADEGYRRALELNPNSAITHDWYGIAYLTAMGRHEEAIAHGRRAKELDPLTAYIRQDLGWSYNLARRYDEAIAECAQIPAIDPNFYFTYWCLGFAYWQKGRFEEAVGAYERAIDLEPEDLHLKAEAAMAYFAAGKHAEAQAILEQLEEKSRREYVIPVALAMTYLAVSDLDSTFTWLDKMYEERSPVLIWMNVQPRYDRLRGDPCFQQLLRKIGFTEAQIATANALAGKRG